MPDRPDRPDPLDRLDALHGVEVPDQWDQIVARAGEPQTTRLHAVDQPAGRPRWMLAVAAAAVLVLGAGAVIAVNANDDEGEITTATNPPTTPVATTAPPPPPTSAPQPSAPPTTSMDTTPAPVDATAPPQSTVVPAPEPPLVSSCPGAEITGNDLVSGGGGFDTFGRLGDEPSIVVTMPQAMEGDLLQTGSIARDIRRVRGGQVLLVQVDESDPGWQLVAIDDDGSIRWRRCGSAYALELFASPDGGHVYVREDDGWSAWRAFDIVSGQDVLAFDVPADAPLVAITDRYALFGDANALHDLRLVDLGSGAVTALPDPDLPGVEGTYPFVRVLERRDGTPLVAIGEGAVPTLAVFVDGAWRTDRSTLLAEVPLTVAENSVDVGNAELGNGVWARDALGATVWFHPIVTPISAEGWTTGVVGDVVVSNECRAAALDASFGCDDPWHIALDFATGDLLWEQRGFVAVGPVGDGLAIIATEGGWSVTDLRTGSPMQQLDGPFLDECCGLDGFVWTGGDGGVVWAVDHETIRIYYPEIVSQPTVEVDLRS